MQKRLCLLTVSLLLAACQGSTESPPVEKLMPPAPAEGFQLAMDTIAPARTEIWKCAVYPLGLDTLAPVNRVYYQQNEGMHHMTLSTTTLAGKVLQNGMYDCEDLTDLMQDATMFFGSQGDAEQELRLPEGVAATLPGDLQVIHEVHYVNTTDKDVEVFSRVNAYVMPQEDVQKGVWGGQVRDENINIPANAEAHTEWTRCIMNEDIEVLFLASHTHQLGIEFTVAPFDGQSTGDIFYRNDDWHSPLITQYSPPMLVKAGEGFEYSCTWRNPHDRDINYGLNSEDEMCNLALVHTPFSQSARCDVVETSDGVIWQPE